MVLKQTNKQTPKDSDNHQNFQSVLGKYIVEEGKDSVRSADIMDDNNFCSLVQPQSKKMTSNSCHTSLLIPEAPKTPPDLS